MGVRQRAACCLVRLRLCGEGRWRCHCFWHVQRGNGGNQASTLREEQRLEQERHPDHGVLPGTQSHCEWGRDNSKIQMLFNFLNCSILTLDHVYIIVIIITCLWGNIKIIMCLSYQTLLLVPTSPPTYRAQPERYKAFLKHQYWVIVRRQINNNGNMTEKHKITSTTKTKDITKMLVWVDCSQV